MGMEEGGVEWISVGYWESPAVRWAQSLNDLDEITGVQEQEEA